MPIILSAKEYKGKQSIKTLVGSGAKLEDIPLNKENTKDFDAVARKYGIDYSIKKADFRLLSSAVSRR
jgi:hypothetical protein